MNYNLNDVELYLFNNGSNAYSYKTLGCHAFENNGKKIHRFAVWAPNAKSISLVGDFNEWDTKSHIMEKISSTGVWQTFVEGLKDGDIYKYYITASDENRLYKADPFAFFSEVRPGTASKVWDLDGYKWHDSKWMEKRVKNQPYDRPISIYEMHLGSWRGEKNYREIADELAPYLKKMGYTHVEFMPLSEYPFDASWGYQVTGFFSATGRYGTPQDLMYLIDKLHKNNIGVIMDWVPAHYPKDAHGLYHFDGGPCFEHPDSRRSEQPDWGTVMFNFECGEVVSFLMSSAVFWLDYFHVDGIRTDAVSSILYLNYSKKDGQWLPNNDGGFENHAAVDFFQKSAQLVFRDFPGVMFCAEESTSWPLVTHPAHEGGLGFNYKWNMGWMHDMLSYMSLDPLFRSKHQHELTFSMFYAFSENFILPLSHDEVVHGKLSLLNKMPGEYEAKFANLRVFLSYMFAHPGKKLMFMGVELGEFIEWRYYEPLEWHLLDYESHRNLQKFVAALNHFYQKHPALFEIEDSWDGFKWIGLDDVDHSIISLARFSKPRANGKRHMLLCAFDFTPVCGQNYRIGVPIAGHYTEVFNSDSIDFGGQGIGNETLISDEIPCNGYPNSIVVEIPPLGAVFFEHRPFSREELREIAAEKKRLEKLQSEKTKLKNGTAEIKSSAKSAEPTQK